MANLSAKPPTVVFFGPMPPPVHGQAIMVQSLARAAIQWTSVRMQAFDAKFADSHGEMLKVSPKKFVRLACYLSKMAWLCLRYRAKVVLLTPGFYKGAFIKDSLFIWGARLLRRRVICWFHMDYAVMATGNSSTWFQWYFKKTLLGCHGFVCCTAAMEKTLPSWLPSQKITALPNGIQAVESPASAETTESFCVLYLSNMVPTKGWQVLLAAAETICAEFPHVVFDFHGAPQQGASEADIQAVFARTGHPDRLIYNGFADADAKKAAWAKADLFCFPTFTEALPLTLLEAMSCGLAVVASRVGGIPDALEHGDGGWLVPPNDVVALAAALREAIQSPVRLDEMGRNNRLRFEANYSLAAFSSRWENYLAAQAA